MAKQGGAPRRSFIVGQVTVRLLLSASLALLAACVTPQDELIQRQQASDTSHVDSLVDEGREVAAAHCASCHAIDAGRQSPLREAPSFSGILARYDPDRLADDLIEGIRVGHDQMPVFDLTVKAADALVAYLQWLDGSPPANPQR